MLLKDAWCCAALMRNIGQYRERTAPNRVRGPRGDRVPIVAVGIRRGMFSLPREAQLQANSEHPVFALRVGGRCDIFLSLLRISFTPPPRHVYSFGIYFCESRQARRTLLAPLFSLSMLKRYPYRASEMEDVILP